MMKMISLRHFSINTKSYKKACASLSKIGNVLGKGCYSEVYALNSIPNLAIRISDRLDGFLRYATLIETGMVPSRILPHCPTIIDMALTEDGGSICLVERLDKSNKSTPLINTIQLFLNNKISIKNIPHPIDEQAENIKELSEYIKDVMDIKKLDLHTRNFLFRNGNVVCNDPISGPVSILELNEIYESSQFANIFPSLSKTYEKAILNIEDHYADMHIDETIECNHHMIF